MTSRDVLRARIGLLESCAKSIEDAYGGFRDLILRDDIPDIRLGDALMVPEDLEDQRWALWEVVVMLEAFAKKYRAELEAQERVAA